MFVIKISNERIQTADLWFQKRPLCQLSHNYCPRSIILYLYILKIHCFKIIIEYLRPQNGQILFKIGQSGKILSNLLGLLVDNLTKRGAAAFACDNVVPPSILVKFCLFSISQFNDK